MEKIVYKCKCQKSYETEKDLVNHSKNCILFQNYYSPLDDILRNYSAKEDNFLIRIILQKFYLKQSDELFPKLSNIIDINDPYNNYYTNPDILRKQSSFDENVNLYH